MDVPLHFENQRKWKQWLAKNYSKSSGEWLALGKKGRETPRLVYAEALDAALCYGWIDAKKMIGDEHFFLQRFVPRAKRSIWSKVNCAHVQRLIENGQMQAAGLAKIEQAKSDGRWDAAYDPASRAEVPADLQVALEASPMAQAFFAKLDRQNRYAILFRIQTVKKPETRRAKISKFIEMLSRGEKLH